MEEKELKALINLGPKDPEQIDAMLGLTTRTESRIGSFYCETCEGEYTEEELVEGTSDFDENTLNCPECGNWKLILWRH